MDLKQLLVLEKVGAYKPMCMIILACVRNVTPHGIAYPWRT
jgi:hypothetical protein